MIRAGKRIQKRRHECHLTAQQLAHAIGVSRSYLTLIETGKRTLPKRLVIPLARQLKVKEQVIYDWFLDEQLKGLQL